MHHAQGNGVRMHVIFFGLVSLGVLMAFFSFIAVAATRMQ